jgi:hypothetical protein
MNFSVGSSIQGGEYIGGAGRHFTGRRRRGRGDRF